MDGFYNCVEIAADLLSNQINPKVKTPFIVSISGLQPFGGPLSALETLMKTVALLLEKCMSVHTLTRNVSHNFIGNLS